MEIYYKSNSVKEGWYPKPLDDFVRPIIWQELFRHPDFDLQGDVINVEPARAVMDHGRRQYWEYKVRYAGGDIRYYQLKCISIPINLGTPEELRLRIESQELRRQEFLKSLSKKADKGVYLTTKVTLYGDDIVCYRKKLQPDGVWGDEDDTPIFARDIKLYSERIDCIDNLNKYKNDIQACLSKSSRVRKSRK